MVIECIEKSLDKISETTTIPKSVLEKRLQKIKTCTTLEEIFSKANIVYIAPGDATKSELKNGTVDIVFSYAVLEHVNKELISNLILESKRILRKSGIAIHVIGLHDHYNSYKNISKVNFVKYSEFWWSFFVYNKISYHNRLREKQFLTIFKKYEAKIISVENLIDPNDIIELENMRIDKYFEEMSNKELAIYYTEIVLTFEAL